MALLCGFRSLRFFTARDRSLLKIDLFLTGVDVLSVKLERSSLQAVILYIILPHSANYMPIALWLKAIIGSHLNLISYTF